MRKFLSLKKLLFSAVITVFAVSLNAQIAPNKHWVQFTDKNNSPFSIDNPEEYLSERALERRQAYDIVIDEYDIPVNPSYLQAVAETGAVLLNPSKWLNGVTIQTSDPAVLEAIASLPFVQNTRELKNDLIKQNIKEKQFFSNETIKPIVSKSPMDDFYGYAFVQINQLNGVELHALGYQGQDMWIGVCDGGFQDADFHQAFDSVRDSGRLIGTKDFVHKNGNVYTESTHGTSCWGLMAGYEPQVYVGTAPLASYFLCRTEDVNGENLIEEYNWVSAAEYLDSLGIDVISTSLGYVGFDDMQWDHEYSDLDGKTAVMTIGSEIACSRGIMCVTSAGNEGGTSNPYISVPADGENVFTIGAVGSNGQRAYFSSVGPTVDGRIKPDVMAHGYGTTVPSYGGSYYEGSGTSFSTPVLAGMLTCLWQAHKEKSAGMLRDIIRQSSNRFSNPDNEYGYGIPDFMVAFDMLGEKELYPNDDNIMISVYPNPSNGSVKTDLKIDGKVRVQIFDQMGKLLYISDVSKDNTDNLSLFLSSVNEGLYLLHINNNGMCQTIKYIKY